MTTMSILHTWAGDQVNMLLHKSAEALSSSIVTGCASVSNRYVAIYARNKLLLFRVNIANLNHTKM